ncbi:MAG: pantetheine-phosphate adenylyltransferase [Chitinivibrionales bacterium]|nr:pantetheine-phosphate adenylyltransferase [Chitinivibrionales bacterium]MBD3356089.1 pantetheine-phosphate adenylyltransferase [Chitinivibrionales bacterium]
MPVAIYPGTFDPVTFGHIDIAIRASKIFRKVYAVVAENPTKKPLFSARERREMLQEALGEHKKIEVVTYAGLIANCVRDYQATAIIRGLRALSDFEYEFQMAYTNRNLNDKADTVFLMPSVEYTYLSSSMVKQLSRLEGDVSSFVPEFVRLELLRKMGKER